MHAGDENFIQRTDLVEPRFLRGLAVPFAVRGNKRAVQQPRGPLERIPLIIYHYVVIVRHMFSVLRGGRLTCMPHTIRYCQDGEKKK